MTRQDLLDEAAACFVMVREFWSCLARGDDDALRRDTHPDQVRDCPPGTTLSEWMLGKLRMTPERCATMGCSTPARRVNPKMWAIMCTPVWRPGITYTGDDTMGFAMGVLRDQGRNWLWGPLPAASVEGARELEIPLSLLPVANVDGVRPQAGDGRVH